MSYVWGAHGPSFEYPTCYRTENRFLTLRAAALFVSALALLWLVLSEPADAPATAALLRAKVEHGSWVPHLLMAVFLMLLAGLDLIAASRQRKVWLAEGQPAPLVADLSFHVTGASPAASGLLQAALRGRLRGAALEGSYQRALKAVSPQVADASVALQAYLRTRVGQLIFMAGLLTALALIWIAASRRPALPLAAMLLGLLGAAYVLYCEWISARAPSPRVVGVVLVVAALLGFAVAWFGGTWVPRVSQLGALMLPESAALLLVLVLIIDGLALLAARGQIGEPVQADVSASSASVDLAIDADRLMQEIDNELVRRWVDGVPNRRYVRRSPLDVRNDDALGSVVLLEESQPSIGSRQHDRLPPLPIGSRLWLVMLAAFGWLSTAIGCVLWIRMANALMQDVATGWGPAVPALLLIVIGGYAQRAGHLAWSRISVDSRLYVVNVEPVAASAGDPTATQRLTVRIVRVTSAFHAAAEHTLGSRRVLALAGDQAAAQTFTEQVKSFGKRPQVSQASMPKPRGSGANPVHAAGAAAARGLPRFCPACGTPVLQAARFCQHCGGVLTSL